MTTTARVYYTGDMANNPGWFVVEGEDPNSLLTLVEELGEYSEGRTFKLYRDHIGNEYKGHCNPRFVTGDAYNSYRQARIAEANAAIARVLALTESVTR